MCTSIVHVKSQRKGSQHRRPGLHTQSCGVIYPHRAGFSRCLGDFSFLYILLLQLKVADMSRTRRSFLGRCQDALPPYEKKPPRNMIAPVKRTNYSPLTTFKTHFYWPIQPNKTLLHEQEKGRRRFCIAFPSPAFI